MILKMIRSNIGVVGMSGNNDLIIGIIGYRREWRSGLVGVIYYVCYKDLQCKIIINYAM